MHKRHYFIENDTKILLDFMRENSFAMVIGIDEAYPVATQIPLEIQTNGEQSMLNGHMAKNSDHHRAFEKNKNVLVVFTGPHCHISASWYEKKNVASTWNYMAVHAKGKLKFTDEDGTKLMIKNITAQYEGETSEASFHNLQDEYVDSMVRQITGFNIEVSSLENVFKLSQNQTEATRRNIIDKLKRRSDTASRMVAAEMEKRMKTS